MPDPLDRLKSALAARYAIERELGSGGMATVYLAKDIKHKRKVAVKVLRPELAAVLGAERFVQEITTTASLQHPHILPLFDSGETEGFLYYVMPYIEGETLRGKLNRETQLSIDEAVKITTEVADALDYAHRQGVIHRDIKPENILLHDGRPVVADFGIALAISAAAGGRMTETGLSLGTPHYMSPEQATAEKELTSKSDIYSLGCVLYEMLTGEPPHTGASAQAIVMKIVTEDVQPVTALRRSVPPHVAAATALSLEKLAADRFESAAKFAEALTNPAFTLPTLSGATETAAIPSTRTWQRVATGTTAVAIVCAALAFWGWLRRDPPSPVTWRGLAFPPGQEPTKEPGAPTDFAFAPDGLWYVYTGPGEPTTQLWIKRREEYEARPLAGTEGARNPAVSPDGQSVAFTVAGVLQRIPASGGPSVTISDSANMESPNVAWLDDGTVVFNDRSYGLRRVAGAGGASAIVWAPGMAETPGAAITVTPLPDSRGVLFGVCDVGCGTVQEVWALDLRAGESHRVLGNAMKAWYAPTGHLIAAHIRRTSAQQIMADAFAIPFDLETLHITGEAVTLFEDVSAAAISQTGTALIEFSGLLSSLYEAVWVDRGGRATAIDSTWRFDVTRVVSSYGWALSPDGSRLAIGLEGEGLSDIWIKQLDEGPVSRLTRGEGFENRPRWTPDGRFVTYRSSDLRGREGGIYRRRADGTGSAELVYSNPVAREVTVAGTGDWFVVRTGSGQGLDIVGFRPGVDSVAIPLLAEEHDEMAPALSPDGRWLAYVSNEAGQSDVYVRPFPNVGDGRWVVSLRGGYAPLWAHSGRELFYISAEDEMVVAEVEMDSVFAVTQRSVLFELGPEFLLDSLHTAHDISPDDRRFIMVRRVRRPETLQPQLVVVDNFFEWLKERVFN
jgi:serine/threonine-protein kinase